MLQISNEHTVRSISLHKQYKIYLANTKEYIQRTPWRNTIIEKAIIHLIVSCVFVRQFWYLMIGQVGLHSFALQPTDSIFNHWWERIHSVTSVLNKKGLNSLILTGAWIIWNHHN
jgi:hypothetical protein